MMNRLRNRASPASTWFGGVCCRPSALRVRPSTTRILVKLVQVSRIAGSSEMQRHRDDHGDRGARLVGQAAEVDGHRAVVGARAGGAVRARRAARRPAPRHPRSRRPVPDAPGSRVRRRRPRRPAGPGRRRRRARRAGPGGSASRHPPPEARFASGPVPDRPGSRSPGEHRAGETAAAPGEAARRRRRRRPAARRVPRAARARGTGAGGRPRSGRAASGLLGGEQLGGEDVGTGAGARGRVPRAGRRARDACRSTTSSRVTLVVVLRRGRGGPVPRSRRGRSGSSSVSTLICCSVVPSTSTREPTVTTATAEVRLSGCRCTTWTSAPAVPAEPARAEAGQQQEQSDDDRQGDDQPDSQLEHRGRPQSAAGVVDDLGDPEAEVLVDHDHLAPGDQPAVDEQVRGAPCGPVQLQHGTGGEGEQVAHGHPGAPELDGDLHVDPVQHLDAAAGERGDAPRGQPGARCRRGGRSAAARRASGRVGDLGGGSATGAACGAVTVGGLRLRRPLRRCRWRPARLRRRLEQGSWIEHRGGDARRRSAARR